MASAGIHHLRMANTKDINTIQYAENKTQSKIKYINSKITTMSEAKTCCWNYDDDDDVQWFNVHLKLTWSQLSLAYSAKVKTDMPEKNEAGFEWKWEMRKGRDGMDLRTA